MEDSLNIAKRKALQSSVAALCVENGYLSSDRGAIEVLTQILQGYISEVGKTARSYCEMAQRLDPIVSDVEMALIDIGSKYDGLNQYATRLPRRHISKQLRVYPSPQPKTLQVGGKSHKPKHIPSHLPPFPDQHTYIKTPIYPQPDVDYCSIKDKISDQQYHSTKSLSRLLAKTQPSIPIAGEVDVSGSYSILLPDSRSNVPVYISALVLPDNTDTPVPGTAGDGGVAGGMANETSKGTDSSVNDSESKHEEKDNDISSNYINPFLKPPSLFPH